MRREEEKLSVSDRYKANRKCGTITAWCQTRLLDEVGHSDSAALNLGVLGWELPQLQNTYKPPAGERPPSPNC